MVSVNLRQGFVLFVVWNAYARLLFGDFGCVRLTILVLLLFLVVACYFGVAV